MSMDDLGNKLGRIHMQSQKFDKLQIRKVKGLKRKRSDAEQPETTTANGAGAGKKEISTKKKKKQAASESS